MTSDAMKISPRLHICFTVIFVQKMQAKTQLCELSDTPQPCHIAPCHVELQCILQMATHSHLKSASSSQWIVSSILGDQVFPVG